MIKVLNIITDLNIGGAGKVLLYFMAKTDREAFDHTVIVPKTSQLAPKLRALGVTTVEMAEIGEKSFAPSKIGAFRREIDRISPDVVHTHASLSARIAARQQGGCAVIHTRHCAYPQSRLKTSFPLKHALGAVNNRLSDLIIAISPAARENLVDTGTDPRKIITMFNGVEAIPRLSDDEKAAGRDSLGIAADEFVCSIIARLVPEKGHSYVIEAADMLRDLRVRFLIAGSGPINDELRADAAERGLDNCIFLGFVDDVTMVENITDLQLNASYGTETSSLSLLEGMSLGTPAVVSDFGGNPCLVTDGINGSVVPRCDAAAFAGAIRRIYNEPESLESMREAAFLTYHRRFTSENMARNIENVYRDAILARK